ncbi:MAG: hypothetical protein JXQ65_06910 [Candidatus Marinimicrobia bacterium]|nr:hypothetical protein [Candidatus Neomarinimicrobiota bacterium]
MSKTLVNQVEEELQKLVEELNNFHSTVEYLDTAKTSVKNSISAVQAVEESFVNRINEITRTYDSFLKLEESIYSFIEKINSIDFPQRLEKIEMTVKSTINQLDNIKNETLGELGKASETIIKADFDGHFQKIQWEIEKSVKSHYQLVKNIEDQRLPEKLLTFGSEIKNLQKEAAVKLNANFESVGKEIVRVISELDLDTRFDKISSRISEVSSRIQSLYDYTERMEVSLKDKVAEANNNQNQLIKSFQNNLSRQVLEMNKMIVKNFGQQRINTLLTWIMMFTIIAMIIFFQFEFLNPFK